MSGTNVPINKNEMPSSPGELKPKPGIVAVFVLTLLTILGSFTGFLRELVIAFFFGTTAEADGFAVVVFYYEFFQVLMLSGIAGLAFIPYLARKRGAGEEEAGLRVVKTMMLWIGLVFSFVAVLVVVFGDSLIGTTMPGLTARQFEITAWLVQICAIGIPPLIVSTMLAALLQSFYRFNFTPLGRIVLNLVLVVVVILFVHTWGIAAAAVGMLVGVAAQLLIMILAIRGKHSGGFISVFNPSLLHLLKLMLVPLLMIVVINYLYPLMEFFFMSGLGEGVVSGVSYGRRLISVAVGLAYSIQIVYFARAADETETSRDAEENAKLLSSAVRSGIAVLAPAAALAWISAGPLVVLLFQRGTFDSASSAITAAAFHGYAIAIFANLLWGLFMRAGIVFRRPSITLLMVLTMLLSGTVFNMIFVPLYGYAAIGYGYSLAGFLSAVLGYFLLGIHFGWRREITRAGREAVFDILIAAFSAVPAWFVLEMCFNGLPHDAPESIIQGAVVTLVYIVVLAAANLIFGRTRLFELLGRLVPFRKRK